MEISARNLNKGDGTYFGPEDNLSEEAIEKCNVLSVRELVSQNGYDKKINLEPDENDFRVFGQNVALVSFIGPYDLLKVKHDKFQINLRGACDDFVTAQKRIHKITQNGSSVYDIFTIGMYEWVAIPPNISFMKDNDLHEEFLNGIIVRHKKNLLMKKHMFEMRKELITKSKKTAQMVGETIPKEPTEETVLVQNPTVEPTAEPTVEPTVEPTAEPTVEPTVPFIQNNVPVFSNTPSVTDDFDSSEKLNQCANHSQNWVIFSTVGNLAEGMAIKIQGFYETEEIARKVMERRRQIDDTFETYVAEAYRWLPVEHDVDEIEDQVFQNEHLNQLYKTHIDEKKKAEDYNRVQKSKGNRPNAIASTISDGPTPSEIMDNLTQEQ